MQSFIVSDESDGPITIRDCDAGLKIAELEKLINRSKQQLKDLHQQIEEGRKEYEDVTSLKPATFTRL